MHSFYCRSERNITADFLSLESTTDLDHWAAQHQMARIRPLGAWRGFRTSIQPAWPEWAQPPEKHHPLTPCQLSVVEWQPGSYTLCEDARVLADPVSG